MALSVWLVWRLLPSHPRALVLFSVQLAVNTLWTWLFFAWQQGAVATADVVLLLVLIVLMIRSFWQRSRMAALLLLPYLLWVGFASVLTWTVWQANPGLL